MDDFIQNCLDKFKFIDPLQTFYDKTGKDKDLIISHKSTIPDLVIWNKTFNKNECFEGANLENNRDFPRYRFYLRLNKDKDSKVKNKKDKEKKTKKNKKNKKNESKQSDYHRMKENKIFGKILLGIVDKKTKPVLYTEQNHIVNINLNSRNKHQKMKNLMIKQENMNYRDRVFNQRPLISPRKFDKEYNDLMKQLSFKKKANKKLILPPIY